MNTQALIDLKRLYPNAEVVVLVKGVPSTIYERKPCKVLAFK